MAEAKDGRGDDPQELSSHGCHRLPSLEFETLHDALTVTHAHNREDRLQFSIWE
jgi:hypothetical protein